MFFISNSRSFSVKTLLTLFNLSYFSKPIAVILIRTSFIAAILVFFILKQRVFEKHIQMFKILIYFLFILGTASVVTESILFKKEGLGSDIANQIW